MSSSEFRRKYATLAEPTEVLAFDSLIGTWIPKGATIADGEGEFTMEDAEQPTETGAENGARMTIRPVHARQRKLRPAKTKPILDPVAMRDHARTRDEEVTPRQYMRRK